MSKLMKNKISNFINYRVILFLNDYRLLIYPTYPITLSASKYIEKLKETIYKRN